MKVERVMWVVKDERGFYLSKDSKFQKSLSNNAWLFSSRRGAAVYRNVQAGQTLARVLRTIEEI
jgi:hypothetical protein